LSYGQQALWFTHQLAPQSWAYHMVFSARLRSEVDVSAVQQSFQILLRRHATLRTTYPLRHGRPSQSIAQDAQVNFESISLKAASWDACQDRLLVEIRRPFDLERGPIMRVRLFSRSARDHLLVLVVHHIAIDFWSLGVLLSEFRELYPAVQAGTPIPLPSLQIQHTDYMQWQTALLAGATGERLWAYWQQQLAGELPVLQLPVDRPRPPVQTYYGASQCFRLSESLTRNLHALAQREGITLYMILLAAVQILLYRYTGQDDILVGSPIAGRNQPQFRQLVGYCVNMVVLRGNLSGNLAFRTFLGQVRHTVLDALRHADYPFPLLVQRLQPARDASRSPLFQVSMALQTLVHQEDLLACFMPDIPAPDAIAFGPLVLEPYPLPQQEGQFDLAFEMAEVQASLCGMLQYNADLFDATTIARMAQHFEIVIAAMAANLDQPVATCPLLTAAERHQLLVEWNATASPYPRDAGIHQLFEAQVECTPDAIAVVFADQQLSYSELNRRANQLGHYLRALGVGPETLVSLYIERSLELLVAILGILKAGGAYVPLDTAYPRDRLAFMIADTAAPVILTQTHLRDHLPDTEATLICVDTAWTYLATEPPENPTPCSSAEHLAYVMYTSGSSGQPKGIRITHRSVNRLVQDTNFATFTREDVFLQYAPIAFDAATLELWGSLLNGGRLVVPPPGPLSLSALGQLIRSHQVTTLWLTAGLFHLMVDERLDDLRAVRQLLAGGDVLSPPHVKRALESLEGGTLINGYGPTENTTFTCCHAMTDAAQVETPVPIGRPIANTQVYILDPHQQPVPIGVPGELCTAGDGLARGYHNRPDLTQECFIPNPFGPGRLYKTGDLARYRPDGAIEFLGRMDTQVKLRGFRIELGEIETVLAAHPVVREAVVVMREEPPGSKQLIAYVATETPNQALPATLRAFLQRQLPGYMIPAAVVLLDVLPLTPNGKLDRHALPSPELIRPASTGAMVPPRTSQEERLATIWRRVLDIAKISVHDNFFELGGHSMQAMQLTSQMAAALHLDVPVHTLFSHPTIAKLAQALDVLPRHHSPSPRPPTQSKHPLLTPTSPFTTFERRPLLPLLMAGDLAPVDAAALAYLPRSLLAHTGLSRSELLSDWCHHRPGVLSTLDTPWGRIALIVLPCLDEDMYGDPTDLIAITSEALALARQIGAATVSLTGLLPSATDYGRALATPLAKRRDMPRVTTGHATTTSAVVLMIDKLGQECGRQLTQECVGFLGMGSIGLTSLYLMLHTLPHPAELLLCDVYQKSRDLETIRKTVIEKFGFQGSVRIAVSSGAEVPSAFYAATLIVGATNVPDILDINRVRPGTLIVDDSAPHCFSPERAIQRFERHRDLLFTEGGALRSPEPIRELRYVPSSADDTMTVRQLDATFRRHKPDDIMGCTLSGLLSSRFQQLQPTIGLVDHRTSYQHYAVLRQLGLKAARLQCDDYVLAQDRQYSFQLQFGRSK
jgi:aspartate racemase